MELNEVIGKLDVLAKRYFDYHNSVAGETGHTVYRGKFYSDIGSITVFSSGYDKNFSVYFGPLEICDYSRMITIPINVTAERLNDIYIDALDYLENDLLKRDSTK